VTFVVKIVLFKKPSLSETYQIIILPSMKRGYKQFQSIERDRKLPLSGY